MTNVRRLRVCLRRLFFLHSSLLSSRCPQTVGGAAAYPRQPDRPTYGRVFVVVTGVDAGTERGVVPLPRTVAGVSAPCVCAGLYDSIPVTPFPVPHTHTHIRTNALGGLEHKTHKMVSVKGHSDAGQPTSRQCRSIKKATRAPASQCLPQPSDITFMTAVWIIPKNLLHHFYIRHTALGTRRSRRLNP